VLPVAGALQIVGGLRADGTSSDTIELVDPQTGSSRADGSLAAATHDAAAATVGGNTYVFGGGASRSTAAVQRLVAGGVARVAGRLPAPRSDLSAATVGDTAYVLGGYDDNTWASTVLRTRDGTSFTPVGSLPVPVRYAAVAVVDGAIWVFGGVTPAGETADVQRIDLGTGRAEVAGRLNTPLSDAVAVVLGGAVYLCGGLVAGSATDAVTRFDPIHRAVHSAGRLPAPVSDAGSAVVGAIGYLVGGEDPGPTNRVTILQLVPAPARN